GSASIDYKRGRLSGHLGVNLTPKHTLTGGGQLGYEIVPGLVALVGIEVLETGKPKISGEVRLPDPLILFAERAINRKLLGVSLHTRFFGISARGKSMGITAGLGPSLDAKAGIGPGQLRKSQILVDFDPKKERDPAAFRASAEFFVPAYAELALTLSG